MNDKELREALSAPFPADAIEWRIGSVSKKGDKAMVLAYLTSRAVMDRLDDVFGVGGWFDDYEFVGKDVICKLSARCGSIWVTKADGAPQTDVESFKGGISDALKRAAVKYGIGRYLYKLTSAWVDLKDTKSRGDHYHKGKHWTAPKLPAWALPATSTPKPASKVASKKAAPKAKEKAIDKNNEPRPSNGDYVLVGDVGGYEGRTLNYILGNNPTWYSGTNLSAIKNTLTEEDVEEIRTFRGSLKKNNKGAV